MRKLLIIAICLFAGSSICAQEPFRVMTYNIKYDDGDDAGNGWTVRKPWVIDLITYHSPTIFGVQEALHGQVEDINRAFPHFTYVGVGRDDGKQAGEYSPVFYDSTLFELINSGTFWLSETPGEVSRGWDAALPRVCTFAELKDKNGASFVVYNAHFDHVGVEARRNSVGVILGHYRNFYDGKRAVFMGDLNFTDVDPAYTKITDAGFRDARDLVQPYGPKATFNGFNWENIPERRIDYVFLRGEFEVLTFGVLTDSRYNRYPSDHFPVIAEVRLP